MVTDKSNPDMRIVLLLECEHHARQSYWGVVIISGGLVRLVRSVQRQELRLASVQTDPGPRVRRLGDEERLNQPCPLPPVTSLRSETACLPWDVTLSSDGQDVKSDTKFPATSNAAPRSRTSSAKRGGTNDAFKQCRKSAVNVSKTYDPPSEKQKEGWAT